MGGMPLRRLGPQYTYTYASCSELCPFVTEPSSKIEKIKIILQRGDTPVGQRIILTPPQKTWEMVQAQLKLAGYEGELINGEGDMIMPIDTLAPGTYVLHLIQPVTGGQVGSLGHASVQCCQLDVPVRWYVVMVRWYVVLYVVVPCNTVKPTAFEH
jgi:hypothetical protein